MFSSLYIHIPFCLSKCSYCSYNSYPGLENIFDRYIDCLSVECNAYTNQPHLLRTLFIGGGTPTILANRQLKYLLRMVNSNFARSKEIEISMELNPGTVDEEKLNLLREEGVNRLSIGVQSFNDAELKSLGRTHSSQMATEAVRLAKWVGFKNINIDLMYGLPGQDRLIWEENVQRALCLGVTHLSLYQLTPEDGTSLNNQLLSGKIQLPNERELEHMDLLTARLTKEADFHQYEISNYALDGFQCEHNCVYWRNEEYCGIGAGAVSYLDGDRRVNISGPVEYCSLIESGKSAELAVEHLGPEESFKETVIMGLRMNKGVNIDSLEQKFKMTITEVYSEQLEKYYGLKLLQIVDDHLQLTNKGRVFANQVMADLV